MRGALSPPDDSPVDLSAVRIIGFNAQQDTTACVHVMAACAVDTPPAHPRRSAWQGWPASHHHQACLLQGMRRAQQTLSPVPVAVVLAPSSSPPQPSPFAVAESAASLAGLRGDSFDLAGPAEVATAPRVRRLPVSPFQGAATRRLAGPGRPAEDPFPLSEVPVGAAMLLHCRDRNDC